MSLGWIKPEDYSFNSFLLLERFQIALMMNSSGWRNDKSEWRHNMGVALNANPAVADAKLMRDAEVYALASVEDFTIYTTPEVMAKQCDFIRGWSKERLFELVDLTGKTVLDVGAGSGRLTFAAAEKAAWVYASEPVGTLREFMRGKIAQDG